MRVKSDMSRKAIIGTLVVQLLALASLLTLALDVRAHARVEQLGGVNVWGYRGPVMRTKRADEVRVAVVGGSLAFGWGVAASETVAPTIRQLLALVLDVRGGPSITVTAVNLGAMGAPWSEYRSQIAHFAYLRPDVLCLYLDPDARSAGQRLPPADSGIAMLTGYVPMLPLVLQEKAERLWTGGAVVAGTGRALGALDRSLHRILGAQPAVAADLPFDEIAGSVSDALTIARGVVVIIPPPFSSRDTIARDGFADRIRARYAGEMRVRIVDLDQVPDLADDGLRLDGRNLSVAGHARVAEEVVPTVLDLLRQRRS
ncbi:MAG: hypothetical protein ABJA98_29575 [Acidobacteriota bacterium]